MYRQEDISIVDTNEIDELIEIISRLKILFHPTLFCNGEITSKIFVDLEHSNNNKIIILDNNFCTYLYEIAKYGKCNSRESEIITGILISFAKLINANLSFGFSLYENDSNEKTIPSYEKEKYANFLINNTNIRFWLDIAEGNYKTINVVDVKIDVDNACRYVSEDTHLLMHKISLFKIAYLLRSNGDLNRFELFITFLNWYIDNLAISNVMIVYAAMIFSNYKYTKYPKNFYSNNFNKVIKGIENQAWDINQITQWSTFYCNEERDNCTYMFATNDIMLKRIIIESIYTLGIPDIIYELFNTKKQRKILDSIFESKLGKNRVKPLNEKDKDGINKILISLYDENLNNLCGLLGTNRN